MSRPRGLRPKTDADLSDRQIKREVERLRGEITHFSGLRDTAMLATVRGKYARSIESRLAIIDRLTRLPQFIPQLPMDMPLHHTRRGQRIPLTEGHSTPLESFSKEAEQ